MPVLLALHDVDGDENDLPRVLRMIAPGWQILSPRITENLELLLQWIAANASEKPYALGYGTGADLAARLLLEHGDLLAGGILLRPSEAVPQKRTQLQGAPVAIITGGEGESVLLACAFSDAGAQLDLAINSGRGLTPQDFALAKQWLQNISFRPN